MKRLWVDANVLLRFLTGEPKDMYERSFDLMKSVERGEVTLFIPQLVAAEVVWVLKSYYKHSMEDISKAVIGLLSAPGVEAEDSQTMIKAIELAREKNVDFIDAHLALRAAGQGEKVCTFDRTDFKRLPVSWIEP